MNVKTLSEISEFNDILENENASLIYFSHEACNVCKTLKPKVKELIENEFPKVNMYYSDTVLAPEIAGQNSVFTVPTILVMFAGKEYIRKSRNIGLDELKNLIERPYNLVFED